MTTFTPPTPYLDTQRLVLEPLRIFHAAEMTRVLADNDLYEFTGGEPPSFEQTMRRYTLMYAGSRHETEQWHNWILRSKASNKAIGHLQATVTAFNTAFAWTIGQASQRQGFAKEASQSAADWLHEHGVQKLDAWIHAEHEASQRVAQSLDMVRTVDVDEDGEERWSTGD